jgi:hypothetical protein
MIIDGDLPVPISILTLFQIVQGGVDVDDELFGQLRGLI